MNKLVEPVTVERVLEEIEDEVTLMGVPHAAPPLRPRSRAAIPIALIVPAVFFGGLVIVLLLRGNPVAAIRGSSVASEKSAAAGASSTAPPAIAAQEPAQPTGSTAQVADALPAPKGVATSDELAAEESQSALLRFMARGTVKDLPAPRRTASATESQPATAPTANDGTSRTATLGAGAANPAIVANGAGGTGNTNGSAGAPVAGKSTPAADLRAAGGADAVATGQVTAQSAQQTAGQGTAPNGTLSGIQGATQGPTQGAPQGAAPNAAAIAAPIAAAVIPAPPPAPLRPIEKPSPSFPVDALRDGIRSGRVLAALTIAPDGSVSNVRVLEFAPNMSFSRAAQRALRNWRFAATGTGGQATIELLFKSEE